MRKFLGNHSFDVTQSNTKMTLQKLETVGWDLVVQSAVVFFLS